MHLTQDLLQNGRSFISSSLKSGNICWIRLPDPFFEGQYLFFLFCLLASRFSHFLTFSCLQTSHYQAYPLLYISLLVLQPSFSGLNLCHVFCTPTPCFPIRKINFLTSSTILFRCFSSFPHYRALLEKRAVTQVVGKLLAFCGKSMFS
jgi:hypothetical protein